jgi:(p)ppGpp synthase/HD superfamily hydrolase
MTGRSGYAQTNLQLYRQLRDRTDADVALVAAAYELALSLFPRSFRATGKPFLCHLVGTASILDSHGAP